MVAWAGIIGAALFGRAAAQVGSWQTLAGYQTASDVGSHSMIDLDMEELAHLVGRRHDPVMGSLERELREPRGLGNRDLIVHEAQPADCVYVVVLR